MIASDLTSTLTKHEALVIAAMQGLLANPTIQMGTPKETVAAMALEYAQGILDALAE